MIAVKHSRFKSTKFLLEAGINVHARDNKAFNYAIKDSDPIMLNLLLNYH